MTAAAVVPAGRPLRAWQAACLRAYRAADRRDFLVTATPGSGKTTLALTLATELLDAREVQRVVVVAPTDHLRTQWAQAAAALRIVLDPTLSNDVGPVRADCTGYVATYAQVAAKPLLHRRRVEARRTLVVLDEVHHAGDGLSWGDAVSEAFDPARRRLCLTGTPFRTRPDERIPFVQYDAEDDGLRSRADWSYGYREALRDGVVRPVVFAAYTGVSRWRNSAGEVVAASLTEAATRETEASAWRTALDPRGEWVPHVIAAMDERLAHQRAAGMPDAAGLVLASDQSDARQYAAIVREVTGEEPTLIVSDDPRASEKISEFARSDQRVAVCVRMISEGVDVVRASCLAWLTSYRTPLFFAQAVGRVVRARAAYESATVFLPAVRPLLELAAELESERNHVTPPPRVDTDSLDLPPREPAEPGGGLGWEALGSQAEFAHVLHAGRAVIADDVALGPDDEEFLGLPGLLSAEQTAALLAQRDAEHRRRAVRSGRGSGQDDAATRSDDELWEQAARLRRGINGLVGRLAARTGKPHAVIHREVRTAVPGPPSAAAGIDVLQQRHDHLMSLLH